MADQKISGLTSASALTGSELFEVVQSGGNYKVDLNTVKSFVGIGYTPVNRAGDTMTGFLTLNADPTSALHAATKQYADSLVVGLWDDRGTFDASVNAYPSSGGSGTAGAILKGDIWTISVVGTLPTGQVVELGDTVRALVNTPGNTQSNWAIGQNNIGYTPITNVLPSANILVGSSGNVATAVSLTGDATLSNVGLITVTKINGTSLAGLATGILKNTAGTGVPSIAVANTDYQSPISLTTTGSTGAATFTSNTLNIPNYTASTWLLASGGTLTGANTVTGSSTNTVKFSFPSLATTPADGAGLWLQNATAAAVGAQQISPSVVLDGNGWKTTATAGSQNVKFKIDVLPIQGTANPGGTLRFSSNVNGAGYTDRLTIGASTNATNAVTVTGLGTTSATSAFIITNGSGATLTETNDDGGTRYGNSGARPLIGASNGTTNALASSGVSLTINTASTNSNAIQLYNGLVTMANVVSVGGTYSISSGSTGGSWMKILPVINNTGTTSGSVLRGLEITSTETSMTGTTYYPFTVSSTVGLNGIGTSTPTATLHVVGSTKVEGSLTLPVAGNGLLIKEGTNATMGVATLVAGTVTVSTTKVTANSRIQLTIQSLGTVTVPTVIGVTARSAGTSFTITSANVVDTSVIAWVLIEPAP